MNEIQSFMGTDHNRLGALFQEFRNLKEHDVQRRSSVFSAFRRGMEQHMTREEVFLFPLYERKTGTRDHGLTAEMRAEHDEIREYLRKISERLAEVDGNTTLLEIALLEALAAHAMKEEDVLYPWMDHSVGAEERIAVLGHMRHAGLPPAEKATAMEARAPAGKGSSRRGQDAAAQRREER